MKTFYKFVFPEIEKFEKFTNSGRKQSFTKKCKLIETLRERLFGLQRIHIIIFRNENFEFCREFNNFRTLTSKITHTNEKPNKLEQISVIRFPLF